MPVNSKHALLATLLCTSCSPGNLRFARERLDLGAVLTGATRTEAIELHSESASTLKIAGTSSSNPSFSLQYSLAPLRDLTILAVTHTPPTGTTEPQQASLRVWTDDGHEAALEVTSTPVTPACEGPPVIEFGAVKPGESSTLELVLTNETPLGTVAEVDSLTAPSGAFVMEHGRYPIAARSEVRVPITFQPPFSAEFTGAVTVQRHPLCAPQRLSLAGTGVASLIAPMPHVLTWSTGLGTTETQLLIIQNSLLSEVALFDLQTREATLPSQVFRAVRFPLSIPPAMRSANGLLIPGSAAIEVSFTPAAIQTYAGQLSFSTDVAAHAHFEVQLTGFGR